MNSRKAQIHENLKRVSERIAVAAQRAGRDENEVQLIAVTKTFPVSDVEILYELGIRNFGENRDQEASVKSPHLPKDARWHFQGQIQSNKLKSIVVWADVVHSLDDLRHAKILSTLTQNIDVFIQVSLDSIDQGRGGVAPEMLDEFLSQVRQLSHLNILGLMAVAPLNEEPIKAFERLRHIADEYPDLAKLSAGMSNDFEAAIAMGATHVRIGSQILGVR